MQLDLSACLRRAARPPCFTGVPTFADTKMVDEMLAVREAASADDQALAAKMKHIAMSAAERESWGGAYKGYSEAALLNPSTEVLLGRATALARLFRSADSCKNRYSGKLSDLGRAFEGLNDAIQFATAIEEAIDSGATRAAIAEAQKTVFAKLAACEAP